MNKNDIIKAIFHSFVARISSLFMKDSTYVKKYYNPCQNTLSNLV